MIELMIVVAIIGIVASTAIPAYTNYIIRSQVANGINVSTAAKIAAAMPSCRTNTCLLLAG